MNKYTKDKLYGPSKRHVWRRYCKIEWMLDRCDGCGNIFSYKGPDTHAAIFCKPTPEWLKDNPEDDGKER